jgi:hypothetical protein
MKQLLVMSVLVLLVAETAAAQSGVAQFEKWNTVITDPQALINDPNLLGAPASTQLVSSFSGPQNLAGTFTARIRARIVVPESGWYTFWVSSNGKSAVYCGNTQTPFGDSAAQPTTNPIAKMSNAVPPPYNYYTRYAEQKSAQINFTAGQTIYCILVYVDSVAEAGTNLNHGMLKWQMPNAVQQGPIPGGIPTPGSMSVPPAIPVTQPPSFNFSLTNGGNRSVNQGAQVTNSVTATLTAGTAAAVTFSATGLPTGASAAFVQASCTPTCAPTMTVTAGSTTPAGTYTVTITATGGGVTRTSTFQLTVNGTAPAFNFSLTNGGNRTGNRSSSVTNSITATHSAGTTQAVTFSASGLPSGVTAGFSQGSCNPTCSPTMTLTIGSSAALATTTITVTATGGGVTRTTTFSLTVTTSAPTGGNLTSSISQINPGQSSIITLVPPQNATSCTMSASPSNSSWTGSASTSSNTVRTVTLSVTTTFTVTCSNAGGQLVFNVLVMVNSVANVTALWDPSASPPSNVAGYKLYYGTSPGVHTSVIDVGNVTQTPVGNLTFGVWHYFAVSAYAPGGAEGPKSTEVAYRP